MAPLQITVPTTTNLYNVDCTWIKKENNNLFTLLNTLGVLQQSQVKLSIVVRMDYRILSASQRSAS